MWAAPTWPASIGWPNSWTVSGAWRVWRRWWIAGCIRPACVLHSTTNSSNGRVFAARDVAKSASDGGGLFGGGAGGTLELCGRPAMGCFGRAECAGCATDSGGGSAKPRMRAVAQAVIALAAQPEGFRAADLAERVRGQQGRAMASYAARKAAYDLRKLRGAEATLKRKETVRRTTSISVTWSQLTRSSHSKGLPRPSTSPNPQPRGK